MATQREKTVKREIRKSVEKAVKKNKGGAFAVILAFLIFAAAGIGASFMLTKNDGLTLNDSNKNLTLNVGDKYEEKGARFVVFGKDVSDLIVISVYDEDGEEVKEIDSSAEGEFAVVYSVNTEKATDFFVKLFIGKYKKFKLVRNVTVA